LGKGKHLSLDHRLSHELSSRNVHHVLLDNLPKNLNRGFLQALPHLEEIVNAPRWRIQPYMFANVLDEPFAFVGHLAAAFLQVHLLTKESDQVGFRRIPVIPCVDPELHLLPRLFSDLFPVIDAGNVVALDGNHAHRMATNSLWHS